MWTFADASQHQTDCVPCTGSRDCKAGSTARVTLEVLNVDVTRISASESVKLRKKLAKKIASTLEVAPSTILDPFGAKKSTMISETVFAGRTGMKVSAVVTVPAGCFANTLAEKLYTTTFREMIAITIKKVLRNAAVSGHPLVPVVALKPERFVPLQPATTTATSTTRTETVTSTTATTTEPPPATKTATTTVRHHDYQSTPAAMTSQQKSSSVRGVACSLAVLCASLWL